MKEQRLASFDAERLNELKRLKLSIKDRIAQIEATAPVKSRRGRAADT